MPVERRALVQLDALLPPMLVEEAELDAVGVLGEEREVRPVAVPFRAERERLAGPDPAVGGDRHDQAATGRSQMTDSGGSVNETEYGCPCHGCASAVTSPRFPTPVPP